MALGSAVLCPPVHLGINAGELGLNKRTLLQAQNSVEVREEAV